ncbi:MAG: TIGR01777 family oxidoreductase [Anaerolineales bacterium]|jgi:hypothetical protein
MRILIAGGSGLIGTALTRSLLADGHPVWVLTRSPEKANLPHGVAPLGWDGRTVEGWADVLSQVDAVVNLAGETLARWPWTMPRKQQLWDSRVLAGQALTQAIQAASVRPQVLIQASGVNFYGPHKQELVTEGDGAGTDFLARLCVDWEASTRPVEELGVRRLVIRTAVVFAPKGGILPLMLLPLRLFAGGPVGGGRQGLAWIHLSDEVAAIRFLLKNQNARGPFNLTTPDPISNADFTRTAARLLRRPYWLAAPAFALRLVPGQMATLVLDGAYLRPARLQALDFTFRFANLEDALKDLLGEKEISANLH